MVIGPPSLICFLNKGITDPLEPNTFPKRTATNSVFEIFLFNTVYHYFPKLSIYIDIFFIEKGGDGAA